MTLPIDPSMLTSGPEWQVGAVDPAEGAGGAAAAGPAGGFGTMLTDQVRGLSQIQDQASQASQALATGQASDPTQVVMDVERARLSMQLASQIRTKLTDSVNDIFHTQV